MSTLKRKLCKPLLAFLGVWIGLGVAPSIELELDGLILLAQLAVVTLWGLRFRVKGIKG